MATPIRAYAAMQAGLKLERHDFDPGPLGEDQVEVAVKWCGVCHSDLSMAANEWGMSAYPLVPGHEVVGAVREAGRRVTNVKIGQTVGVGWFAGCCQRCRSCLAGDQNLCATAEQTIVGRPGGFADRLRCQDIWATPLPEGVDPASAGPLFCGGLTVFNPLVQFDVRPTWRVGVIGIGGLGHMALQFCRAWGCEVVAFTSSDSKRSEALGLGAHRTLNSRDDQALAGAKGTFDLILSTVNVSLNWGRYLDCLAPRGRLHTVGAILEPMAISAFGLLLGQKSVSGSPLGSPATLASMLEFCARHRIKPTTETFPMSKVNDALAHVQAGKARYRVVLENDFK